MDQVIAFFILNVKMLKKDKLKMVWSLVMPAFFLIINSENVKEMTNMRFGWAYIILSSYIYGIGIHSLTEKEAGTLKTAFSISGKSYTFFFTIISAIEKKNYIFDEPFASVDAEGKELIISILKKLVRQGKNIIITSHEEEFESKFHDISIIDLG